MGLRAWFHKLRSAGRESDAEKRPRASAGDPIAVANAASQAARAAVNPDRDAWEELLPYRDVDPAEHRSACVIAAAIAAGDRPTSSFAITRVAQPDEEHRRVSLIAAAIAAGAMPESSLIVKRIYKQRTLEENHAA